MTDLNKLSEGFIMNDVDRVLFSYRLPKLKIRAKTDKNMKSLYEKYEKSYELFKNHLKTYHKAFPDKDLSPSALKGKMKQYYQQMQDKYSSLRTFDATYKLQQLKGSKIDMVEKFVPDLSNFTLINRETLNATLAVANQHEVAKAVSDDFKTLSQAGLRKKAENFMLAGLKQLKAYKCRLYRYFILSLDCTKVSMESLAFEQVNNTQDITNALNKMDKMQFDLDKLLEDMGRYDGDIYGYFYVIALKKIKPGGSSYIEHKFNSHEGVINPENKDNECFKYCTTIHSILKKNPKEKDLYRVSKLKKYPNIFDFTNVNFPATLKDIIIFEHNNKIAVSIFQLRENTNKFDILYHGNQNFKDNDVINLLLLENGTNHHYCYIKNIAKKLHNGTKELDEKHLYSPCLYCYKMIKTELLSKHQENCVLCKKYDPKKISFPEEKFVEFDTKKRKFQYYNEFAIYADFESSNKPCNKKKGSTHLLTNHVVNSYGYLIIDRINNEIVKYVKYRASDDEEDVVTKFLLEIEKECAALIELRKQYRKDYSSIKGIPVKKNRDYKCHICSKTFKGKDIHKNHSHYTNKFIGLACRECNVNFRPMKAIPCVFHNFKGYDGQFIISKFFKAYDSKTHSMDVIQQNSEKLMSMTTNKVIRYKDKEGKWCESKQPICKFIDSAQHLVGSIEKLTESLTNKGKDFSKCVYMKKRFEKDYEMMCKKGHYPYEWVDSCEKFNRKLPKQKKFYSNLHQSGLSNEEYEHVENVYEKFGCKNFGDYHDLYLATDVFLLADIVENYSKLAYKLYGLDPLHFISSPSLAWNAMLKFMKESYLKKEIRTDKIELVQDYEIYNMFARQKKGGFSFIGSKRHEIANNKYMQNYDETLEQCFIIYLDANNLYPTVMMYKLPYGGFKWVTLTQDEIMNVSRDSNQGYVIDCDITFPEKIHDLVKEFVPAPEIVEPKREWMSQYQLDMSKNKGSCEKLVAHLHEHKNYVLNYINYQMLIKLGCEIKINKVLQFEQENFMAPFISVNTEMRKKSKTKFEKDFYKLLNNSVYGKTMQSNLLKKDIRITTDEKKVLKWRTWNSLKRMWVDDSYFDGVYIVEMKKTENVITMPEYVGFQVLDLSKEHMYNFHYNVMKNFDNNIRVLMSDTDSLIYSTSKDIYEFMDKNRVHFDLSESEFVFPDGKVLNDTDNEKKLGKFKAEMENHVICEFVGNVSKSYSIIYEKGDKLENKKTLKGVPSANVKNDIKHKDFTDCVLDGKTKILDNCYGIRSIHHQLYTTKSSKIALQPYYDKQCMIDNINTLPYGHYASISS